MSIEKRSATAQWMLEHPNDTSCPPNPNAAAAWRRQRGIGVPYAEGEVGRIQQTDAGTARAGREDVMTGLTPGHPPQRLPDLTCGFNRKTLLCRLRIRQHTRI
jgi:hypothetical protein